MKTNVDVVLTDSFNLSQLVESAVARKNNIVEQFQPPLWVVNNLQYVCGYFLDGFLDQFPELVITSGYRCPFINQLVKGVVNSQHTQGQAIDFYLANQLGHSTRMDHAWEYIKSVPVDQAIRYKNYFHVSWKFHGNRKEYHDKRAPVGWQRLW